MLHRLTRAGRDRRPCAAIRHRPARRRAGPGWACAAVLLAALSVAPPGARAAHDVSALAERAQREGAVRVLVGLDAPGPGLARGRSPGPPPRAADVDAARASLGAALRGTGHRELRAYGRLPLVALEVDAAALERLSRLPGVRHVEADRLLRPALSSSVPSVQADAVHSAGSNGAGWEIAVLDTGIDASHPFLAGRVVAEACFSAGNDCPSGGKTQFGPGAGSYCTWAGRCAHGTHVAGIAASADASLTGVAPGASLISVRVFSQFTGAVCAPENEDPCALVYLSDLVAGLDHVLTLAATRPIAAVNVSVAGATYTSEAACNFANPSAKAAIDALRDLGIPTVAAAGNDGETGALAEPACISSAVAVGATDDGTTVYASSNWASFLDLAAPGVSVTSSTPPGLPGFGTTTTYNGTSMAAPHVAGALALLRPVAPGLTADALLAAVTTTGTPVTGPGGTTVPRIRAFDAWQTLLLADCDDGLDDDGDGLVDFPADPGCADAGSLREDPACDDGIDNDGDGGIDWDGAGVGPADPQCVAGSNVREQASGRRCGLGFEVAGVLWLLSAWHARRRGRRPGARRGGGRAEA